jgi:hypothetical protein
LSSVVIVVGSPDSSVDGNTSEEEVWYVALHASGIVVKVKEEHGREDLLFRARLKIRFFSGRRSFRERKKVLWWGRRGVF